MAADHTTVAVGKRIRLAREARGLSVPQLAERVDLDRTHMWRIEARGQSTPNARLKRIARALGVDFAELLLGPSRRAR